MFNLDNTTLYINNHKFKLDYDFNIALNNNDILTKEATITLYNYVSIIKNIKIVINNLFTILLDGEIKQNFTYTTTTTILNLNISNFLISGFDVFLNQKVIEKGFDYQKYFTSNATEPLKKSYIFDKNVDLATRIKSIADGENWGLFNIDNNFINFSKFNLIPKKITGIIEKKQPKFNLIPETEIFIICKFNPHLKIGDYIIEKLTKYFVVEINYMYGFKNGFTQSIKLSKNIDIGEDDE